MRHKPLKLLLVGAALAALCAGTAIAAPTQDRDRDQTQDQIQDPDKLQDQDRLRDQDKLQTPDQDRDQTRDRDRLAQDQLSSFSLLTSSERDKMIERLRSAKTTEERSRVRDEYQKTIRTRAQELGLIAPFGPGAGQGGGNGAMLMGLLTDQERTKFYQQMRDAKTSEERNRIRAEHQNTIRERAQQMGIDLPPNFGFGSGPGAQQQMQQQQRQQMQQQQMQQRMQQQQMSPMGGGMGSGMGGGMGSGSGRGGGR